MKIAVYPGSFNPWHLGHEDVLQKALRIFDIVIVAVGTNPEKPLSSTELLRLHSQLNPKYGNVVVSSFDGLLVDYVNKLQTVYTGHVSAVIRGLRNGYDLQYETNQQYWNEDLGLTIPIVHFICDRKYLHISSTYVRMMEKFKSQEK